jgi:hypothetical protein
VNLVKFGEAFGGGNPEPSLIIYGEGVETITYGESPVMKDLFNTESVSYKRSLLIGMLLGDASSRRRIRKDRKLRVEFAVYHSHKQQDLVEWKAAEIDRLLGVHVRISHIEYSGYQKVGFSFTSGKRVRVIHDWFHRGRQKVITPKIRFMDHPIGLAILLCDDGSVRKRKKRHKDGSIYYLKPSITIATHGFSHDEVELLLIHIQSLCGAEGYINVERRVRQSRLRNYPRVNFNVANSKLFWNYVKSWIPRVDSMLTKFEYAIEHWG